MPKERGTEWQHVIILEEAQLLSNSKLKCIYCDKEFRGGVAHIRGHFLGDSKLGIAKCLKVPDPVTAQFKREDTECTENELNKRKSDALDKATSSTIQQTGSKQLQLTAMITQNEILETNKAIARLFYANELPFAIADNKYFKEALSAVAHAGPNYKPPGRAAISTTMLEAEVSDIDKKLTAHKKEAAHTGLSIVSDGWSKCAE